MGVIIYSSFILRQKYDLTEMRNLIIVKVI